MPQSRNVLAALLFVFVVMQFFITGGFAHEWMAPRDAAKQKNPITAAPSSVAKGKELFLNNCAYCHGEDARGMSAEEAGLKRDTPDLKMRLENHTVGDFFWKIQNGRGEMPAFRKSLSDEEIWHVINFIKSK